MFRQRFCRGVIGQAQCNAADAMIAAEGINQAIETFLINLAESSLFAQNDSAVQIQFFHHAA